MARKVVRNAVKALEALHPEPKPTQAERHINRRVAAFEAQRALEDTMAAQPPLGKAGVQLTDMNPVDHQRRATFQAKRPFQPGVPERPANAAVQRVQRPQEAPGAPEASIFDEMTSELSGQPAAAPVENDTDVESILKRFKGSPDEIVKQLAKSYSESEKRMRHLEAERKAFTTNQPLQSQPGTTAVAQPVNQIRVQPTFDYKRFKDNILDKGDEIAQDFEKHIVSQNTQAVSSLVGPLAEVIMEERLYRKFGDVVNEENIDVIKAMAQNEPGANPWERIVSAANKYKTVMPGNLAPKHNPEIQAMQDATQAPSPQARTSGEKKMWKESVIRAEMQKKIRTGEYQRDNTFRTLVSKAYEEGRVLKGQ